MWQIICVYKNKRVDSWITDDPKSAVSSMVFKVFNKGSPVKVTIIYLGDSNPLEL